MQGVEAALITIRLNVVTVVRRTILVSGNRFNVPGVASLGSLPRFAKMNLSVLGVGCLALCIRAATMVENP